ncbi:1,4-alpha-glucan branching protein [Streptomyces sp. ISL-36]|uniref:maltokinase N-terminal cap-like domain-containing protein n=1 Tax=Streptomyces sp. ISL-36 TaxID=2819182 RepID=UPI001BE62C7A|nr:1,4-alpha-glucan branching protein [Streptomyces sp. ISL-36]MBT2441736.1 1,4-alpha-glucan branching protein [Streptomyces sp. ISL-36]
MAVIHRTTMNPGKLELIASWLPSRPWYVRTERGPELSKAGGFRLDDPQGEVGIEFMVVTDGSGEDAVSYHLPLTYRGAPLDGAEQALVGTSEHGVLGRRWVYDGVHDPVLVAQLIALVEGRAEPQAQSESDTPDPSVIRHFGGFESHGRPGEPGDPGDVGGAGRGGPSPGGDGLPAVGVPTAVAEGPDGTDLLLGVTPATGATESARSPLTLTVARVLRADGAESDGTTAGAVGGVSAGWRTPDGRERRGPFVVLRETAR